MTRARILILEEDRQLVDELRDDLDLVGFETEVALSSQVAFTILGERKMDLAIMGASTQAIDTLRKLHQQFSKLPIIFLTEQKSKRYQASLLKEGASAVLEMPLDKNQVITKIEQIIEKPVVQPPKKRRKKPSKEISKKKKKGKSTHRASQKHSRQ